MNAQGRHTAAQSEHLSAYGSCRGEPIPGLLHPLAQPCDALFISGKLHRALYILLTHLNKILGGDSVSIGLSVLLDIEIC